MTLAKDGAELMIGQHGETVTVYSSEGQEPQDGSDPIYFEEGTRGSGQSYDVRLYTAPSKEMLEDYGFDEKSESIMYSTSDIADQGDEVEYSPQNYHWIVTEKATNQIGNGAYIFVYSMGGL